MDNTEERVIRLLREHLDAEHCSAVIDKSTTLESLALESLDKVEAIMAIEEEFGIEILDETADTYVTVGDVVAYVEKNA